MAQDAISIKGTKNGLVIILSPSGDFEEIKAKLKDKISSAKDFFQGAKFTLHTEQDISQEETLQLEEICCEYGLIPGNDIQLPKPSVKSKRLPAKANRISKEVDSYGLLPQELNDNCLFLHQNIRSGQKINYAGHITILGDVNAGAQIIAGGNILVMGTLRGIAHAGATGNTDAIIVAHRLQPSQLRIGEMIARAPEKSKSQSHPERAYLNANKIVIEPYAAQKTTKKSPAVL